MAFASSHAEGSKLSPDFNCNKFTNFSFNVPKIVSPKKISVKMKGFSNEFTKLEPLSLVEMLR